MSWIFKMLWVTWRLDKTLTVTHRQSFWHMSADSGHPARQCHDLGSFCATKIHKRWQWIADNSGLHLYQQSEHWYWQPHQWSACASFRHSSADRWQCSEHRLCHLWALASPSRQLDHTSWGQCCERCTESSCPLCEGDPVCTFQKIFIETFSSNLSTVLPASSCLKISLIFAIALLLCVCLEGMHASAFPHICSISFLLIQKSHKLADAQGFLICAPTFHSQRLQLQQHG